MIDREGKRIVLSCDKCPDAIEGEPGEEFKVFWANAKAKGWRAYQIRGEWMHRCPDCGVPT